MLKYLAVCSLGLLGGGATRTEAIETGRRLETERTPLVPLVSIRELHEDFSGKVEDAECARKPELHSVRYSDDDCTPDSDDECGDEDRRV